jgi:excinuclease ABC subunit A
MANPFVGSAIRLRGVRHNNLKNFDLDLPFNQLIVITGLSGSGKSSLAFDTLFAEGQRRYIETFSPYARQFFDRMDKPQVDSIEGIPPAIAIEQRNAVKTTRSTVGTMTEVCDYMKVLWPYIARLHCRQCGQPVQKDSPQQIWEQVRNGPESLITFDLPLTEKLPLAECLVLVSKQGYQRLLVEGRILRLDELAAEPGLQKKGQNTLTVVQDRVKPTESQRARFVEACEQAYHFGKGKLMTWELASSAELTHPRPFSNRLHCARCDIEYREPSPALFSFNHPVGACPTCRGFGRVISIDYNLAMPDRSKTLRQGVVKPWQTGHGLESQEDLMRACRELEIPTDVPFFKLAKKWQTFVIDGDPDYGKDEEHEWPRAWYGVKGYFRWLESKAYKMHVRVLLSRYRAYTRCPVCEGKRFQPEALLYRARLGMHPTKASMGENGATLAEFYQLPIRDAFQFIQSLSDTLSVPAHDPIGTVLSEVSARLGYLNQVGLGYLTLDRPTRSLSGGETERVNLTTCLGTRLVNTLFVLDEPSVGLHSRDTERLVGILQRLRDAGNTVVVVEHEASVMKAADQIVDLGPGHGASGGQVVFQGSYRQILSAADSLTGQYLSGHKRVSAPQRRPVGIAPTEQPPSNFASRSNTMVLNEAAVPYSTSVSQPNFEAAHPVLRVSHATQNNLDDLTVEIPLRRLVCITGVSGSGKTTLVREVLLPALSAKLKSETTDSKASERLDAESRADDDDDTASSQSAVVEGIESLDRVILVDQSILGKTPRSNPAVYIGAFDDIRDLFAQSDIARRRGLNSSAFSFNSAQGQCERCRGAGFEKIEMQFLSDVFIRCPDCDGRRYREHILEIKIGPRDAGAQNKATLSIGDLLDSTVDEAIEFLEAFSDSRAAQRAATKLRLLQEVGLGYLKLGQPINTLSGGESQRLKLVRNLADSDVSSEPNVAVNDDQELKTKSKNVASSIRDRTAKRGITNRISDTGLNLEQKYKPSTLFLFDEPTTGLHFDDVQVLLKVFQRLVDAGHSLVVIEHNLDLIKAADWLIDLGPEAGDEGGQIVAQGTPESVAACAASHTGQALTELLAKDEDKFPVARQKQGSSEMGWRSKALTSK